MKSVAGRLRLDLAQYRELEAFSAFASDLDKTSRAQLDKGARLVELLKQPQFSPFSVEDEIVSIWAGTTGQLDDIPISDVRRFEGEFLQWLKRHRSDTITAIATTNKLTDDDLENLKSGVDEFKGQFLAGETGGTVNEAPATPIEDGAVSRETVTREVRPAADQA
jgi:F-type H+-transporting ATPase subunit alpha